MSAAASEAGRVGAELLMIITGRKVCACSGASVLGARAGGGARRRGLVQREPVPGGVLAEDVAEREGARTAVERA